MIPVYHAITGRLAQPIRDALAKEIPGIGRVWLVREHRCGLTPKMYKDGDKWIPINGGSLLSPEWSIARHLKQVERYLGYETGSDFVPPTVNGAPFYGLICIDSEAYFPRLEDTRIDAKRQHTQLFADGAGHDFDGAASHALSTYFTSFADQVKLCRPKAMVGFYGLPTWRDGSLTDAVERRVDVTFPCAYTSTKDAYETAKDRVARAKREAPTKPAIAFVCPFREVDGLPPLTAAEFKAQCDGARAGGAYGLCMWWNADDTTGLTKFIGQMQTIKAAIALMTAERVAALRGEG